MNREPERWYTPTRKLKLDKPIYWKNHYGGWREVVQLLTETLHTPDGTRLVTAVEDEFYEDHEHYSGPIREPWTGFIHQVPQQYLEFPDLERLIKLDAWRESLEFCQGLWTLTEYQKNFLLDSGIKVPIAKVQYPISTPPETFSFERFVRNRRKRLACIGEFLRNFQAIYDVQAQGYHKIIIRSDEIDELMRKLKVVENDSVASFSWLSNEEYDKLLAENLVFLNLFDAGAVTTVIECIMRGTPVVINKVGGVPEYLGEEYPLYYETLDEATAKISNLDLIEEAASYLKRHEIKKMLSGEEFINALQTTAIYRSLPTPRSQQRRFKSFDLSVVICSYKRVYNIERLLGLLADQDFEGSFEVIIWNNNIEAFRELDDIQKLFADRLELKVIHSTENFYCQIRMAMPSLIRSDLVMICDDDVKPQPGYLSRFMAKHREYGPEAVLCARGHVFLPHELNEERPEVFWTEYEHMKFYDEGQPDRRIHFMHADNCLITKSLLRRAAQHELDRYDYILVDDYWLSYILSAELKIPIWKIQAGDVLSFTECAEDESIAMFHNPLVHEQRINFYIHHMRRGWPPADDGQSRFNGSFGSTRSEAVEILRINREIREMRESAKD
ncbi:MAG TPA: glycosyltransferase [Blastocatellia bacterium]|nr:glycosyltransferase [Blastocatellia bacterium]